MSADIIRVSIALVEQLCVGLTCDEEGRLTKIERDFGHGNLQTAYEHGYNSDGVQAWKRDWLNQQEYRYLCRVGCGGVPTRIYYRSLGTSRETGTVDFLVSGLILICLHRILQSVFTVRPNSGFGMSIGCAGKTPRPIGGDSVAIAKTQQRDRLHQREYRHVCRNRDYSTIGVVTTTEGSLYREWFRDALQADAVLSTASSGVEDCAPLPTIGCTAKVRCEHPSVGFLSPLQ